MNRERLERNIPLLYQYKFFRMFLLLMPVIVPFFHTKGLQMKEIYLLQSIFAVSVFIMEVPSGYISDLIGRRFSLIWSSLLSGIGFSLFPLAHDFFLLAVAEVILAVAVSLASGTDTSLIYDSLEALGSKKAEIKILGRTVFYMTLGEGIAGGLASLFMLYSQNLNIIATVSAVMCWIPLFICWRMEEPPRKLMDRRKHKENFIYIYASMFKHSALLNMIILNMTFYFTATLFAVWMFQKYWQNISIPLIYFGFLWALTNFVVSVTARYAHKIEKRLGSTAVVLIIGILPIGGYLGIGVITSIWGVFVCLLFQICRGLGQVILKDALNKRVSADFRATANSIVQMSGRILFMVVGPLIGYGIDHYGIHLTAQIMGYLYILIFLLVMLPLLQLRGSFISVTDTGQRQSEEEHIKK